MKERPILFSAPMVKAIIDGRKTQTRRIVKPQPPASATSFEYQTYQRDNVDGFCDGWYDNFGNYYRCPYGQPGDRLWVRETWQHEDTSCDDHRCGNPDHIFYRATDPAPESFASWRPSIFMQRWASRITLEITAVRVERVQSISARDALEEGIQIPWMTITDKRIQEATKMAGGFDTGNCQLAINTYRDLWESINGPGSWASNPWVWVIEFKRLESKP